MLTCLDPCVLFTLSVLFTSESHALSLCSSAVCRLHHSRTASCKDHMGILLQAFHQYETTMGHQSLFLSFLTYLCLILSCMFSFSVVIMEPSGCCLPTEFVPESAFSSVLTRRCEQFVPASAFSSVLTRRCEQFVPASAFSSVLTRRCEQFVPASVFSSVLTRRCEQFVPASAFSSVLTTRCEQFDPASAFSSVLTRRCRADEHFDGGVGRLWTDDQLPPPLTVYLSAHRCVLKVATMRRRRSPRDFKPLPLPLLHPIGQLPVRTQILQTP